MDPAPQYPSCLETAAGQWLSDSGLSPCYSTASLTSSAFSSTDSAAAPAASPVA
jgi:hypothetical protein